MLITRENYIIKFLIKITKDRKKGDKIRTKNGNK